MNAKSKALVDINQIQLTNKTEQNTKVSDFSLNDNTFDFCQHFFESFDGPVYWISYDLTYLKINKVAASLANQSLIGKKVGESNSDQHYFAVLSQFTRSKLNTYNWVCNTLIKNQSHWFELKAIRDPKRRMILLFGHNISERQRLVENLKSIEKVYTSTIETIPIAISHIDSKLNILKGNAALYELTNYFSDTKVENFKEIFDLKTQEQIKINMQNLITNNDKNFSMEIEVHDTSKKYPVKWILFKASLLSKFDQIFTVTLEDLTENKLNIERVEKANCQLRNAEKMSALGEMAAGLAHEINNPLAIISGRITLLIDELKNDQINKIKLDKALTVIERTTERINKVVKGLTGFSFNANLASSTKINFSSLIQTLVNNMTDINSDVKIDVIIHEKNLVVEGHLESLAQAISNIISNATEAAHEAVLAEKWVKITVSKQANQVLLEIRDCGIGIPKHLTQKIFEPFYTTKGVGNGTGLGLSFSKGIVESHGGVIILDTICKDTNFILKLPISN